VVVISLGEKVTLFPQAAYPSLRAGHPWLCLAFLQAGVTVPSPVTRACGGLLPHLFTLALTPKVGAVGGLFSVALSRDCSLRVLPGALPYGARTFLTEATHKKVAPARPPSYPSQLKYRLMSQSLRLKMNETRVLIELLSILGQ